MTPEIRARQQIDTMLAQTGWIVQDRSAMNLHAGPGVVVRELPTATGPTDYMLFLDRKACGVLEAKPAGTTLLGVGPQAAGYAAAAPATYPAWANPLPLYFLSTGAETLLRDGGDPRPAPRPVFAVHRPETLRRMLKDPGDASVPAWLRCRRSTRARCATVRSRPSLALKPRSPPVAPAPWCGWRRVPARPTPPAPCPTAC